MENSSEGNRKGNEMRIGFIGLGLMGSRMAARLQVKDFSLAIYNRSEGVYGAFDDKVERNATASQCVENSDVVFTMLSTQEAIEEVALGQVGFLNAMKAGSTWVDCSTVSPSFSKHCCEEAAKKGIQFVEAPVAGSTGTAAAGQLVFLVGGVKSTVEPLIPLLNLMGKKVMHVGAVGSASATKLLINYALASAMINFSEIVKAGRGIGLSDDFLFDQLPNFPVMAPFVQLKATKIRNADYSPEFPLEWMVKDINLLEQTLEKSSQTLPMLKLLRSTYREGIKKGQSREDFSSVIKVLS